MTHPVPAGKAIPRTRSRLPSISPASAASNGHGAFAEADGAIPQLGVTIFGCGRDEARLIQEIGPRLGIMATITDAALSEVNAELAVGNHCISVDHKAHIGDSTLLALGQAGVRYISTRSVGSDHIDVHCARRLGISVETVAYSPDSVADYTLMLILMVVRNAKSTLSRVAVRDYRLYDARGKELRDLTVGVVGTGRIGRAVIDRLRGFGCHVLACDRCPHTDAEYVPLDELLKRSDVVTLHTPLNPGTRHLLNRRRIKMLRDGAFIINTGRGALLDTEALLAALETGQLGGAALDVLEGEEGVFYLDCREQVMETTLLSRLERLPNVVITPHTAYYTEHALRDVVENTLVNCLRFEGRATWSG